MTALASSEPATTASTRGAGHLLAPLATALLAGAAAAATYQVFIRTSLGQTVDTAAMRGGDVSHPRVVEILSRTLNGTTLASLVLVCLAAAAVGVLRKRLDLAVGAGLLVIGANASAQLLKLRLDRPNLDDFPAPNSFPSGHTVAAASVAFALILVLPHAVRGTVTLAGAGYVTVIAVATVWAEWHRPSDTVAALLIVLAWGSMSAFLIRARRMRVAGPAERASRLATLPLLLVGTVTAAAGLLGLAAVVMSERVTPDFVSGRFAFLSGSAGITAAVAGAFLVWVRLASGGRPADLRRAGRAGDRPTAAGKRSAAGARQPAAPGKQPAGAGRRSAATGKQSAAAGRGTAGAGKQPAAPGTRSAAAGKQPATTGKRSATLGKQPAATGKEPGAARKLLGTARRWPARAGAAAPDEADRDDANRDGRKSKDRDGRKSKGGPK